MKAVGFGINRFHQLGPQETEGNGAEAVAFPATGFRDIRCGGSFTVVLTEGGGIEVVGVVNGRIFPKLTPIPISLPIRVKQAACGKKHTLLLMEGGVVMSFGVGFFGQLGHGDDFCHSAPKLIEALNPKQIGAEACMVAAGGSHSAVLFENGHLFMFGLNRNSQCGVSARCDSVLMPTLLEGGSEKEGGKGKSSGSSGGGPSGYGGSRGPSKIIHVVCGRSHSALVTAGGELYSWGGTTYGRLGVQRTLPKIQPYPVRVTYFDDKRLQVVKLVTGDFHMVALCSDGGVYTWGYGSDGQLGQASLFHFRAPKQVDLFADQGVNIVDVECGGLYTTAVDDTGGMWSWGYGDGGWLGIARTEDGEPPNFESENPTEFPFIEDHEIVATFMSQMCVIVPKQVKQLIGKAKVLYTRCGDGHCIVVSEG